MCLRLAGHGENVAMFKIRGTEADRLRHRLALRFTRPYRIMLASTEAR